MPHGPTKLILIRAGRYDYAEVELRGTLQIVGPNNTGKTTLINTLQFLYLDDRRHMDFGSYTAEQTRDYYFPNQYSYILFECVGVRGQCVLGWRGTSKAAGGDPERFGYEGPFDPADFLEDDHRVREPKAVSSRLGLKNLVVFKTAQEHREFLLPPTRGHGTGAGLVGLRDADHYPHFRETLKNLLCLSIITQDQMRERLLMLAGLPADRCALDVRQLFGDDYERILRLKQKLLRFKKHQARVEQLVDAAARRDRLRGEQIYRWSDLRGKRLAFETAHQARLDQLAAEADAAANRLRLLQAELADRRQEAESLAGARGALEGQLAGLAALAREFTGFVEPLARTALRNLEADLLRLQQQLGEAERETRPKAEQKVALYRELVARQRRTLEHFDRALLTVLRRDLSLDELDPVARLFNFDLLEQPVGKDGVEIRRRDELAGLLRLIASRIRDSTYRDPALVLPLPPARQTVDSLADPEAVRERLAEEEDTLRRWERILNAITERESLQAELTRQTADLDRLRQQIFRWDQYQTARAEEPRLEAERQKTEAALAAAHAAASRLEGQIETVRKARETAETARIAEENQFNAVMGRYNLCDCPEFDARLQAPEDVLPGDFDTAVALFLRAQKTLEDLNVGVRERFLELEGALGSEFTGPDEAETLRTLREELEALPDREEALRRNWEHQLHQLRATFDHLLRDFADIKSAADRLNRALGGIPISNLKALHLDVIEHADIVGSLRRLANLEQPGLFDDSAGLESAVAAFRQKFEASPLLRYADLFTLRFTVTGDDGKPHAYHDFRQVESHGTTITIKVLFNLLVLRSLLREDHAKGPLCEVPFFLDEIHSLDAVNRHAILTTARRLGFIAITAAPEPVSEVEALYFLQPRDGRIILRQRHRVGITRSTPPLPS
ncbi:MAG TPA: hypothetical protein PKM73_00520 [Verrucomicrobiota bacterium]|nr:hypothetical protein [Verrucomicrobiota bacterium]HNU49824.1 hypothetical protein [Verrucomicrobiota bacterium]